MAISKELQKKLDYYEQVYFATDKPIPFKDDLMLYPVLVENYYAGFDENVVVLMTDMGELSIRGEAEDEMAGWHHRLDGHEFE